MELKSCLISNQKLIQSSVEVFNFAAKISAESSFLTSDLILAAVWYCLNQSDDITDKASEIIDKEHKRGSHVGRKTGRVSDDESAETEVVETDNDIQSFNENDSDTKTIHQNKGSSVAGQSDRNCRSTSQTSYAKNVTDILDPINTKAGSSQNISNHKSNHPKEDEGDSVKAKLDLVKVLDKKTKLHSTITAETNSDLNVISDDNKNENKTKSLSVQKGQTPVDNEEKKKQIGDKKDKTAEVEIISIDDDDSNDSENISKDENVTDVNKEKIEEKEPDYFDMDCDEIDDDDDDDGYDEVDEVYEDISNDVDQSVKAENDIGTSSAQKDADVTIISDDEDDCETPLNDKGPNSTIQSSKETYKSNLNESQKNTSGDEKSTKSKRKQSFTNIKEDFPANSREKSKEKKQVEGLNVQISSSLVCPVMEHLDSMSRPTLSVQGEKKSSSPIIAVSDECAPSDSTPAELGLMPVNDIHNTVTAALIAIDESTTKQNFPTLTSTQSVYVSSDMQHGSISSLPAIEDLQHVATDPPDPNSSSHSASSTSETTQLDGQRSQTQTSIICEPEPSTSKSPDVLGSPLRKKRLLDHDKKWHKEPKFTPEQDKYLALPGGVEGNSVLNDWRQPGNYTSVSEIPSVPSIGIEKVDSDYMNYQSIREENFLVGVDDEPGDDYVDESDNAYSDSESEDEGKSRKRKKGSIIGRKRRGRPRLHSPKRNNPSGMEERGKGPVRGRRGRPPLRNKRMSGRGAFVGRSKTDKKDVSPSKFSSLQRDSKRRKIGFYSIKVGKPKHTSDTIDKKSAIKNDDSGCGRPRKFPALMNIIRRVEKDKGVSSFFTGNKDGKNKIKCAKKKKLEHKQQKGKDAPEDNENQDSDVIIID